MKNKEIKKLERFLNNFNFENYWEESNLDCWSLNDIEIIKYELEAILDFGWAEVPPKIKKLWKKLEQEQKNAR